MSLPTIAANRRTEPQKLSALVHGELDWIVMKALEKDRTRRYETASKFAEDVQHYLNGDAVEACPPSAAYQFSKFVRRNRAAIGTTVVVAVALITGTAVATWQALRATNEWNRAVLAEVAAEQQAERAAQETEKALLERDKASHVATLLQEVFSMADPTRAGRKDYTVEQLMDEFAIRLDKQSPELANQPEVEMTLRGIIGKSFRSMYLTDKARPQLERALELTGELFGERHVKYADALLDLGVNQFKTPWSDGIDEENSYRQALAIYKDCGEREKELSVRAHLMSTLLSLSRTKEAEQMGEEALRIADQYQLGDSMQVTDIICNLSVAKSALGDDNAGLRLANEAINRYIASNSETPEFFRMALVPNGSCTQRPGESPRS